jgi:hypothetical protein
MPNSFPTKEPERERGFLSPCDGQATRNSSSSSPAGSVAGYVFTLLRSSERRGKKRRQIYDPPGREKNSRVDSFDIGSAHIYPCVCVDNSCKGPASSDRFSGRDKSLCNIHTKQRWMATLHISRCFYPLWCIIQCRKRISTTSNDRFDRFIISRTKSITKRKEAKRWQLG